MQTVTHNADGTIVVTQKFLSTKGLAERLGVSLKEVQKAVAEIDTPRVPRPKGGRPLVALTPEAAQQAADIVVARKKRALDRALVAIVDGFTSR